jgi:hypothetical protein
MPGANWQFTVRYHGGFEAGGKKRGRGRKTAVLISGEKY